MNFFVYLLRSLEDSSYYVGITNDLDRRLKEHNNKKLHYTSKHAPYEIVWFKEYSSMVDARKHEKWLKNKNRLYKDRLACVGSLPRPFRAG